MATNCENVDHTTDTNYPNTYAYDFVRGLAGHTAEGTRLDRGTAGQMCKGLALALGIPERDLVCRLADYAKANDDDLAANAVISFQQAQQVPPAPQVLTLSAHQLKAALALAWPDGDADPIQGETVVTLCQRSPFVAVDEDGGNHDMPAGLYMTYDDMPDEGIVAVGETEALAA